MLPRLRLPAIQFYKCLVQGTIKNDRGVYTASNKKFQPLRILQREQLSKFIEGTRDFRFLRRLRVDDTTESRNKPDSMDPMKTLFFLKNTEISKLLDEARKESNNPVYATPMGIIMRPMNRISSIQENEVIPPEDVETELYDVQYIMDPSYQERLYQENSKHINIEFDEYNTSGPITWNLVR